MKTKLSSFRSFLITCFSAFIPLLAGTPEQEKAFTDKYKTAFEAKDTATLESFLYTKDANPMALEFYKMMMTEGAGGKISKIELIDLSPEDAKKAEEIQEGPGGHENQTSAQADEEIENHRRDQRCQR